MRTFLHIVLVSSLVISFTSRNAIAGEPQDRDPATLDSRTFPPGSLSNKKESDEFRDKWYSKHLKAMEERNFQTWCVSEGVEEGYRFIYLGTWDHPACVRVIKKSDSEYALTFKSLSGEGGYEPGRLVENWSRDLTKQEWSGFNSLVDSQGYWSLASFEEAHGLDGSQWIIEGWKDGRYHVVDRWTPESGPVVQIGMKMLALVGIQPKSPLEEFMKVRRQGEDRFEGRNDFL